MQVFGIVALSMAIGLLLAVLLAGIATVVYYARSVKIQATALTEKVTHFYAENSTALDHQRGQLTNIADSAKSNLASTRQEMRTALENNAKAIAGVLEDHRRQMDQIANKINATALLEASRRAIEACARLERVASALWKWAERLDQEAPEEVPAAGEWTEDRANEYAPEQVNGPTIYSKPRPEDILAAEESEDRVPVGL